MCGGIITWLLGVSVFLTTGKLEVFSLGYQDVSAALRNDFPWKVAGLIMIAKLLVTIVSYAFGGCGGVFGQSIIDYLRKEGSSLPEIQKTVTYFPDQTVNEIGDKFIASPVNVLVVVDREDGSIKGIITMHDLIRAQVAMTE